MTDENRVPMQDTIAAFYADGSGEPDGQVGAPAIMRTSMAYEPDVRLQIKLQRRYLLANTIIPAMRARAAHVAVQQHPGSGVVAAPFLVKMPSVGPLAVYFETGMHPEFLLGEPGSAESLVGNPKEIFRALGGQIL